MGPLPSAQAKTQPNLTPPPPPVSAVSNGPVGMPERLVSRGSQLWPMWWHSRSCLVQCVSAGVTATQTVDDPQTPPGGRYRRACVYCQRASKGSGGGLGYHYVGVTCAQWMEGPGAC